MPGKPSTRPCKEVPCDRTVKAFDRCGQHDRQFKRHGRCWPIRGKRTDPQTCNNCGDLTGTKQSQCRRCANLRLYGLTKESYARMLAEQGGTCAICPATVADSRGFNLHVDHDRACCPGRGSCGRCVRALLCSKHNAMLGHLGDSIAEAEAVVGYLRRFADHTGT